MPFFIVFQQYKAFRDFNSFYDHTRKKSVYCIVILWMIIGITCQNKKGYKKNNSHADIADADIEKGETLAAKFCQSCHLLPDPSLLDANTWSTGVLPQMGPRLGIFEHRYQKYPNNRSDINIGTGFYPGKPLLSDEEWQRIIDYYTALSPDSLAFPQKEYPLENNAAPFEIITPEIYHNTPATCFAKFDTIRKQLFVSDIISHAVYRFDQQLKLIDTVETGGTIVDMIFRDHFIAACNIGVFTPVNGKFGSIQELHINNNKLDLDKNFSVKELMRPVQLAEADLNGDNKPDYVICEFGYLKGELSWMEAMDNGTYTHHILSAIPGAVRACINDYNHDGLPDIWVLFAQGDEGIVLYTNEGKGRFSEKKLLRFPPCYGSTYFELDDFNGDGYMDLIYTCGDNGDYSAILKPYHGIYIYLNDGKNNFSQKYFYPMNGCYKATAKDFDGDGDLDIAAIAYFADYKNHPEEGFEYLQNDGSLNFSPSVLAGTQAGRWITMDVADIDGDGKADIILGNCSVGPTMTHAKADWKTGPPFIMLKNIHR